MAEIVNIGLIGLLIFAGIFVAYKAMTINRRVTGDVYTDNKDEADFGRNFGPVDEGLTDAIRKRIYERDGRTCQITKRQGIRGQPDNGFEYISVGLGHLTGIGKSELEVGHFPIPHGLGGTTTDDNLILMTKGLNRKLSNAVTLEMEEYCRRHGKKIWSKGIRRKTVRQALMELNKNKRLRFSLN